MQDKKVKPQLHQSHLQILYRCGEKFKRIVLDGEREPATTPLVVGSATHSTVARNLNYKIERGFLLPRNAVKDFSRDDFLKTWDECPIVLNEEERTQGLSKVKGLMQDQTIALVTEHHYEIANKIQPKIVERKFVLEAKDYPYDISGMIDVDEGKGIRDTKTMKFNKGSNNVHRSDQYTTYSLAKYILDGKIPEYIAEDALIKPTKTQPAKAISYYSKRTREDFDIFFARFCQSIKVIESGLFLPANPWGFDSPCNYCGFAQNGSCKYFNTKRIYGDRKPVVVTKDSIDAGHNILDSLTNTLKKEGE